METPNHSYKTYKFNFWKDRFWMWALCLPFGLIGWATPFVVLFGLMKTNNSPDWFPIFGFIFLGIPCYLVGWIFVYSLMEGIYTKVTIAENWVSIRLPWLIFPIIPVVKRIGLERIHRINLFAPYGSRIAVFLYYLEKNKERHFYLPRFTHNPAYIQMMLALKDRIEPPLPPSTSSPGSEPPGTLAATGARVNAKRYPDPHSRSTYMNINGLITFSILAMIGISGWITLSLPISSKADAFSVGFSLASTCFWLGFCGFLPAGLGPIAFWFLGRPAIHAIMWLFQIPDVNWDTPAVVNRLLAQLHLPPIHSTLVEFIFWATLVISIEITVSNSVSWLRRQAYKKFLQSQEKETIEI